MEEVSGHKPVEGEHKSGGPARSRVFAGQFRQRPKTREMELKRRGRSSRVKEQKRPTTAPSQLQSAHIKAAKRHEQDCRCGRTAHHVKTEKEMLEPGKIEFKTSIPRGSS
jgi:hypothetical protein